MDLHYETISEPLLRALRKLMSVPSLSSFYLVGGTALSLQAGHRKSIDIDLFTSVPYGEMDLDSIKDSLVKLFPHIDNIGSLDEQQILYTLYIGDSPDTEIKLDLCYDDIPIFPIIAADGIRMVSDKEISAMKMLAITTGSRRKDFWDIHELLDKYSLDDMIKWGLERYPYSLNRSDIIQALLNVWDISDETPVLSLKGGYWEFVADDIQNEAMRLTK